MDFDVRVQRCLFDRVVEWLDVADALLTYTSKPQHEQFASVMFAHAVWHIGKAVGFYRAELRLQQYGVPFYGLGEREYLALAREVVEDSTLSVFPSDDRDPLDDLWIRVESIRECGLIPPVDGQRIRENIWTLSTLAFIGQQDGVRAILTRPIEEFAPPPPHLRQGLNPIILPCNGYLIFKVDAPGKRAALAQVSLVASHLSSLKRKRASSKKRSRSFDANGSMPVARL